jgi:hypothetical protein
VPPANPARKSASVVFPRQPSFGVEDANASLVAGLACGDCAICGLTTRRGYGLTHCPAHHDEHPSLSIDERLAKVLFKCWAGCSQAEVIDALRARGLWRSRR